MQNYLQPFDKAKDNFGFYQNEILLRDGHLKRISCLGPATYYKKMLQLIHNLEYSLELDV